VRVVGFIVGALRPRDAMLIPLAPTRLPHPHPYLTRLWRITRLLWWCGHADDGCTYTYA
jgi:hypothetical protein